MKDEEVSVRSMDKAMGPPVVLSLLGVTKPGGT